MRLLGDAAQRRIIVCVLIIILLLSFGRKSTVNVFCLRFHVFFLQLLKSYRSVFVPHTCRLASAAAPGGPLIITALITLYCATALSATGKLRLAAGRASDPARLISRCCSRSLFRIPHGAEPLWFSQNASERFQGLARRQRALQPRRVCHGNGHEGRAGIAALTRFLCSGIRRTSPRSSVTKPLPGSLWSACARL